MPDVHIRHPEATDGKRIGAIHVEAWQWAYRDLIPDDDLDKLDAVTRGATWTQRLADEAWRRQQLLAEVAGTVVGFVNFEGSRDDDASPQTGEVTALYLDPAHVGTGVGRVLFGAAFAQLRDAGYRRATVWVLDGNQRGRRFYEQAGMVHDGTSKREEIRGFPVIELRYAVEL